MPPSRQSNEPNSLLFRLAEVLAAYGLTLGAMLTIVSVQYFIPSIDPKLSRQESLFFMFNWFSLAFGFGFLVYKESRSNLLAEHWANRNYTKPTGAYPDNWSEIRQEVLERDEYRCGNCGSTDNLHVHHIVPLSLGGSNLPSNLRTLCKSCHQRLHPHMKD